MFRLFTYCPKCANFENVQQAIQKPHQYILINVLPIHEQDCLISNTIHAHQEEQTINAMIESIVEPDKPVIVYGKNSLDERVMEKAKQIGNLGVSTVYTYMGGMFEWLLLQDIYGDDAFPTTKKVLDILKYKPVQSHI